MAKRPCLTCGAPTTGTRCPTHTHERKNARNASAAALGPCPQHGLCSICNEPARDGDPLTWDHTTPRGSGVAWADPTAAQPAHRSCNSRKRDRPQQG